MDDLNDAALLFPPLCQTPQYDGQTRVSFLSSNLQNFRASELQPSISELHTFHTLTLSNTSAKFQPFKSSKVYRWKTLTNTSLRLKLRGMSTGLEKVASNLEIVASKCRAQSRLDGSPGLTGNLYEIVGAPLGVLEIDWARCRRGGRIGVTLVYWRGTLLVLNVYARILQPSNKYHGPITSKCRIFVETWYSFGLRVDKVLLEALAGMYY